MKTIVFATHNVNKLDEVRAMLPEYTILGLNDLQCTTEIPENCTTFYENAALKVQYVVQQYGYDCFSDDSGLSIDFLEGKPGVFSARYAGEPSNADLNIEKVCQEMQHATYTHAHFVTVIALYWQGKLHYFEGKVFGTIVTEKRGTNGFGYDPIFIPEGFTQTFAEMTKAEKAQISHRGIAIQQLLQFLKQNS